MKRRSEPKINPLLAVPAHEPGDGLSPPVSAVPPMPPVEEEKPDIVDMLGDNKEKPNITAIRVEKPISLWQRFVRRWYFTLTCISHTWTLIRRNKLNYCLGLFSCFVLVMVVALVQSVLNQVRVCFLPLF